MALVAGLSLGVAAAAIDDGAEPTASTTTAVTTAPATTAPATATTAPTTTRSRPPISTASAERTERVALRPDGRGGHSGVVVLNLRNDRDMPVRLGLRYLRDDGGMAILVRSCTPPRPAGSCSSSIVPQPATVLSLLHPGQTRVVQPHAVGQLALRLTPPSGRDASAIDGTLVIRAQRQPASDPPDEPVRDPPPRGGDLPAERLLVRLVGAFAAPAGVRVEPASVTMHLNDLVPVVDGTVSGSTAKVDLRGVESQQLLGDRAERLTGTTLLRNDDGHAISARWAISHGMAAIRIEDDPAPGTYSGRLTLLADTDAPVTELTVSVRHAWHCAFLTILAGALLGGFLPIVARLRRRKVLMRTGIKQAILEYAAKRPRADGRTWVDDQLDLGGGLDHGSDNAPWRRPPWIANPDAHGALGFFSRVQWARSEGELDNAKPQARAIESSIARWMKLRPHVVALRRLVHASRDLQPIGKAAWDAPSGVAYDTRFLLAQAKDDPGGDDATDALVLRLRRQRYRHKQLRAAWKACEGDAGADRAALVERLMALVFPSDGRAPIDDDAKWYAFQASCDQLRDDLRRVTTSPDDKTPGVVARAVTAVRTAPRRYAEPSSDPALLRKLGGTIQRLWWSDLATTALGVAIAVTAYTWALYGVTWGAPRDYAAAFAAGFAAQAVAAWAAMPIFAAVGPRPTPERPPRSAQPDRSAPARLTGR